MSFFKDKIVIITGAGSGIGRALAENLAGQGAIVIISDINHDRIEAVALGIEERGDQVDFQSLDVTDPEVVLKMVDSVHRRYGRIDYIFNNAGIAVGGEVRDLVLQDWHDVLDVNLNGVINGIAAAYPIMTRQGFGHIVNTGSIEGLVPFPGTVSYVASKYAVVGMSNALRIEGAPLGVKVSVICPGHIKTRIFEDSRGVNIDKEKATELMKDSPGLTPDECARVILKGVKRNKAIIPVHWVAKFLWRLGRIHPPLVMGLISFIYKKKLAGTRIDDKYEPAPVITPRKTKTRTKS